VTDDETWVDADHANTLNQFDAGDTRTTHAVIQSDSYWVEDCENAALRANGANDGPPRTDKQPLIAQTYPIDDGRPVEKHQNGTGIGEDGAPAYTLDRQQHASVVQTTTSAALDRMTVRRLTPVECERLMGFPDGFTAPEGVKAPDSKRYAACGDGIVAPVAFWIADRIRMIEEEEGI
jgi:site-specific DNA-cytosine methylase